MARSRTDAFCGIDVGTQGVRVALLDPAGRLLDTASALLPSSHRAGDRHEQQPDDWWAAACTALTEVLSRTEVSVVALALDATSGTVLVEDGRGRPRGAALMYDDGRAAEQAQRAQDIGAAQWSALGYRMQPAWALPKVMWLLEKGMVRAGDRVVHQSDHLVGRLAGGPVATDTSHALKTGADPRSTHWPADVLAELGVALAVLPDLVLPGAVLGTVGADAAGATGLPQGTPIRAGMTDGCAAQIAAGALAHGAWSSALGTTLVVKGATPELVHDRAGSVYCHRHPDGGWLPGGASSTGAGAVAARFPELGPNDLAALTRAAGRYGPGASPTYPLVGAGERFPFVAPAARGFLGGDLSTDAEIFAALCHGVAYVERLAYDVLGRLGAEVSGPVALTGGATRNAWWNQLRTDVLGRPTYLPENPQPAAGMAVLAAAPPGELTATARRMVRVAQRLEPDGERGAQLRSGYAALVAALVDRGWLPAAATRPAVAGAAR